MANTCSANSLDMANTPSITFTRVYIGTDPSNLSYAVKIMEKNQGLDEKFV